MIPTIFLLISFCFYMKARLDNQDKYLSTYIKAFASHNNNEEFKITPIELDSEPKKEERKPRVYSPRHDIDSQMSGKVIDPFD